MSRVLSLSLILLVALVGSIVVGSAAEAIPCLGAGDVTLLGSAGCVEGGLQFHDFNVSPVGVAARVFLGGFTSVIGQDVNLNFQISHDPSPANLADILLYYTVQTVDGAMVW